MVLLDQFLRLTNRGAAFVRFMRIFWANVGWVLLVLQLAARPDWVVWTGTPEQWAGFGRLVDVAGRTWSLADLVNVIIATILVLVALVSLVGPCWRLRRFFGRNTRTAHA